MYEESSLLCRHSVPRYKHASRVRTSIMSTLYSFQLLACLFSLRIKNGIGGFVLCPNLGCTYSSLGCSLTTDERELFCANKNIKGPLFVTDLPTTLEKLYLNNNNITVLEPKMFTATTNLRILNLNNNEIVLLKDNTFATLKNLADLRLENNEILNIPNTALTGLVSLAIFKISGNPASRPTAVCSAGKFLKTVALAFDGGATSYIYECKPTILCDGCNHDDKFPSTETPLCTFDQLTITFDCTNAGFAGKLYLKSIPERAKIVKLSQSRIESIDDRTFRDLEDVEVIDLSENKLSTLYKDPFSTMNNLKTLMLQDNPISQGNLRCADKKLEPRNETLTILGNGNSITWETCAPKSASDDSSSQLSHASKLGIIGCWLSKAFSAISITLLLILCA
jgi:Leucine-rich repeat (LRR) protein